MTAISTALEFVTNEESQESYNELVINEETQVNTNEVAGGGNQRLLIATGFFVCVFFVSYLRKTLYSFAIFVGGMANVR